MRRSILSFFLFITQFCTGIFAQNPYIRQYTTHDGLPSNTIYQMCQDSHKFLWFTSDAGVVKFDGTNFTIYSKKDGLSCNDVVRIKEDMVGRVWFFNYNGTVNYYYNDKIYNGSNAPFLNSLISKGFFLDFFTDNDQTINFYNWQREVFSLDKNNNVTKDSLLKNESPYIPPAAKAFDMLRIVYLSKSLSKEWIIWSHIGIYSQNIASGNLTVLNNQIDCKIVFPSKYNSFYVIPYTGKSIIKVTKDFKKTKIRFPGNIEKIRTILEDSEGYLWIATLDEGVYCFKDDKVVKKFKIENNQGLLQDHEQNIWVSTKTDGIFMINHECLKQNHFDRTYFNNSGVNQLSDFPEYGVWCLNKNAVFLYGNNAVYYQMPVPEAIRPADILYFFKDKTLLLGAKSGKLYTFENISLNEKSRQIGYTRSRLQDVQIKKIVSDPKSSFVTIFNQNRFLSIKSTNPELYSPFTSISERINNVYYNSKDELVVNSKRNLIYRGNRLSPYAELSRFDGTIISDHLVLSDSVELFNIDGDSIYLFKQHRFYNLSKYFNTPISLQIKKALYEDSTLYLSTSKDIFVCFNPIRAITGKQVITKPLNISFNNINDILLKNDSLYIASDDGLTIISKSSLLSNISSPPIPYLRSITVNDKIYSLALTSLVLTGKNNIQLSFGCISYFSSSASYSYMLEGAEKKWIAGIGSDINLFYRNLPPGKYKFKLRVQKSDSGWSEPLVLAIIIKPTLLEYPAFWAFIIVILGAIILFFVFRIKSERIRRIEIDHQLVVLEQKALQSMMNPHFIFNSLGSIQNYLLKNKGSEAIIYLSNFARLIRQNLNAINTPMILLAEEIEMLTNYLDLEKIRLENKFDYSIQIEPALEEEEVYIPSMIIQPVVENSIWHGIALLKEQGNIRISFKAHNDKSLKIIIEDNGIGMNQSGEYSNNEDHRKHLGMRIIKKRLNLLGKKYATMTSINYSESSPDTINPGTLAELIVPFAFTIPES